MKKLKSTTPMLLAMIVLLINILAQAQTVTDKSENTDDQVSVSEEQSIDTPSNSDLEIMVYQYENGERNVVYTGALGGYDGGRWSNINFTGIQFFMLWNLSNSDNNEVLYIAPVEPQDEPQNEVKDEQNTADNAVLALQTRGIECNVNLMYDGAYSERIMIRNQQLSVPIKISNTSNSDRDIICYFAEYDENGQLLSTVLGESIPIGKKRSIVTNITKTFSPEAKTAKIFVWDNENLQPVTGAITLDENDGDYYADTMEEAQTYDTQYSIKGMINTEDDVDYIKIVPEVSGLYTLNCISLTNAVATLYNHRHTVLSSRFKSYQKTLYSNQEYYIKITGDVGDYLLTIQGDVPSAAENFSIYDFDIDTNVYKKSILNMCQELLYSDEENSRKMYREYEKILQKESELHRLPDFLAGHPKELENFDEVVNQYYATKYNELAAVRQEYLDLIDQYTDVNSESVQLMNTESENEYPIVGKYYPSLYSTEGIEDPDTEESVSLMASQSTPSLTITKTTSTSITYNVTFPVSGATGNAIYLVNFNNSNGYTTEANVYGSKSIHHQNGTYNIDHLHPGGIYIVEMLWSTDGGKTYGEENSICRFVQLPCETTENLQMYDNGGRVAAYIEPEDKKLANYDDFETWLDRMDKTYGALRELTGYTPYNAQKIIMQSTRENLNERFNNVDGKNYWWVTFGYADSTRIFKHSKAFTQGHMYRLSQNDWGFTPIHELSHTFDCNGWNFDSETLAQFKSYYVCDKLKAKIYEPGRFNNSSHGWYTVFGQLYQFI